MVACRTTRGFLTSAPAGAFGYKPSLPTICSYYPAYLFKKYANRQRTRRLRAGTTATSTFSGTRYVAPFGVYHALPDARRATVLTPTGAARSGTATNAPAFERATPADHRHLMLRAGGSNDNEHCLRVVRSALRTYLLRLSILPPFYTSTPGTPAHSTAADARRCVQTPQHFSPLPQVFSHPLRRTT